jgi:hypothetical protein
MIVGIVLMVTALVIVVFAATYKPYMHVDSWGEPAPDEACGYACIMCIVIILAGFLGMIGFMAFINGV